MVGEKIEEEKGDIKSDDIYFLIDGMTSVRA